MDNGGKELEIENQVIGSILFESKEAEEYFIHCIKTSLTLNFQYKVVHEKEVI